MPAYGIFIIEQVKDAEALAAYPPLARAARGDHAITPLALGGEVLSLEGAPADRIAILEFPDMAAARAWYFSAAYKQATEQRLKGADCRAFLVEGLG